jgi:alkanesulfonate monooxygenase SsuD/methylene tetrahydromethanopterin reductase-like flavin-dependent oxidoreductase (luciferase family)
MEFGLFNQMYHPLHRRADRTEHDALLDELAIIEVADRVGFKYAWSSEHHFLDEYSHLSASEAFMAYALARTTNIHIGSGIINITPPVSAPARVAEKVAMLDHLGAGRFEFGVGRGSSSTEVYGFGIDSMETTRAMFDEALPEIIKMMGEGEYGPFEGRYFSMPRRNVLPKPYTKPHPPVWVAAGSPGTFEKAARLGIGVLCFTLGTPDTLAPLIEIYKNTIDKAEPVGGYVNDNVMVTTDMMVLEDGQRARQVSLNNRGNYHTALLLRYLDSFPISEGQPKWPDIPPPPKAEQLEYAISKGIVAVGTPEEAICTLKRYESVGADQIVFGTFATDVSLADATEAYETFGKYVLPEFDKDPVHSTTRQRDAQLGARVA